MSEPYYPGEWDNEPDDDLGYDPDFDPEAETRDILSDPDTMAAIEEGESDDPDYENPGESDGLNDDEYYGNPNMRGWS